MADYFTVWTKNLVPFYWNLARPPRCRFAQCDLSLQQALVQEKQVDDTPAFSPEFCKYTEQMNKYLGINIARGYQEYVYRMNHFLLYIGVQHELDCTEHSCTSTC